MGSETCLFRPRQCGCRLCDRSLTTPARLTPARPEFPPVLDLRSGDGLPLHVGNRVRAATGERLNVIFPVSGASAAGAPGRGAGMLPLELPRYLSGSMLFGGKLARADEREGQCDADKRCASDHGA